MSTVLKFFVLLIGITFVFSLCGNTSAIPPRCLYVATCDKRLEVSRDNGETWEDVSVVAPVESLAAYGDYLYVGSKREGLFVSDNNGQTWKQYQPSCVSSIAFGDKCK